ncbi:hypothetical protein GCM10027088_33040 [Nocardia goodfellowii]
MGAGVVRIASGAAANSERRVAEAIAVLGDESTAERVAVLLKTDAAWVDAVLEQLTEDGLIEGGRLCLPTVRQRLLRDMSYDVRRILFHRAAGLLHEHRASAGVVAELLLGAGHAQFAWATDVLRAAAEQARRDDRLDSALQYLELAYGVTRRAADRAAISAQSAAIESQVNPSTATRSFTRVTAAARTGLLEHRTLPCVIRYQLWHGCLDDAEHALTLLARSPDTSAPAGTDEVDFLQAWLAYSYPDLARPRRPAGGVAGAPRAGARSAPALAATVLSAIVTGADQGEVAAGAQRILAGHRLSAATVDALTVAVESLILVDRLPAAASWCDVLLAEAQARHGPAWKAIFAGLRADIALRQGDLATAERSATLALNQIPAKNLGTMVGGPIAILVSALTAAGRLAEARTQLARAVPESLFRSRFGLGYLHARGHLALAEGRVEDAITDFRTCGDLMRRWDIDLPGLVPWRNDLAEAYLRRGEPDRAKYFASSHLARLTRADAHPTGGVSLRLLAAARDRRQRLELLRESEAIARVSGDKLEIARVLAALAEAYRVLETPGLEPAHRSRTLGRQVARMARECGAARQYVEPHRPALLEQNSLAATQQAAADRLSPAEARVARLAADGARNRDIADALGVTISTVEQHLTRAYRKLNVARRSELRYVLRLARPATAASTPSNPRPADPAA